MTCAPSLGPTGVDSTPLPFPHDRSSSPRQTSRRGDAGRRSSGGASRSVSGRATGNEGPAGGRGQESVSSGLGRSPYRRRRSPWRRTPGPGPSGPAGPLGVEGPATRPPALRGRGRGGGAGGRGRRTGAAPRGRAGPAGAPARV